MKKTKDQNVNNELAEQRELVEAINQISREREISKDTLFKAIENALLAACKNEFNKDNNQNNGFNRDANANNNSGNKVDNIKITIDRETGKIDVLAEKTIVEKVNDKYTEISMEEAERLFPNGQYEYDDKVNVVITPKNFMRISAQKAKQAVVQKIREEERKVIYNQFAEREHEIVTGLIQNIKDHKICTVNLGKTDAILAENEMIPGETLRLNQKIKVYIIEVKDSSRGPKITVSRARKEFVERLFEQEVAEVSDGIVEIKSIAREAGYRTKIAVYSSEPEVDPVGACVGLNGERVNSIVEELNGEKIDIITWSDDPAVFIENALSPAKVISVEVEREERTARVIVPDSQLSLAIGREGQNSRLAAKLTGYKIDIKPDSQPYDDIDTDSIDDADDFYFEEA